MYSSVQLVGSISQKWPKWAHFGMFCKHIWARNGLFEAAGSQKIWWTDAKRRKIKGNALVQAEIGVSKKCNTKIMTIISGLHEDDANNDGVFVIDYEIRLFMIEIVSIN